MLSIKISFRVNNYKAYMYLMTDNAYKRVTRYADNNSGHIKLLRLIGMQLIEYIRLAFYRSRQGCKSQIKP